MRRNMEFEEDFEYSSGTVGVHRSAGGAVTEEGQTDGDLLLVQPFNKPVDQFGVPSRTQDGECPLGGVEMVVDQHSSSPPSEESGHSASQVTAEDHSPQSQLVPNSKFKGNGCLQPVVTQGWALSQITKALVPHAQRTARLEEEVTRLARQKVKLQEAVEKVHQHNEMSLDLTTPPTSQDLLSPTDPWTFRSLHGLHPYGQVQAAPLLFSPNTSLSANSWPVQEEQQSCD